MNTHTYKIGRLPIALTRLPRGAVVAYTLTLNNKNYIICLLYDIICIFVIRWIKRSMSEIGVEIKKKRIDRDKKLYEIAVMAKIKPSYLSRIERGKVMPGSKILKKILIALGVEMRVVLDDIK